jgi:hypothetical protein
MEHVPIPSRLKLSNTKKEFVDPAPPFSLSTAAAAA